MNDFSLRIVIFIFLLDRSLQASFLVQNPLLNPIYVLASKAAVLIVISQFFRLFRDVKKIPDIFLWISLWGVYLIINTFFHDGDIMRSIQSVYPFIGMNAFIIVESQSSFQLHKLINSISICYLVLAWINLCFIIIDPYFFGVTSHNGGIFFLGIENQIGYTLLLGFIFNYLNHYYYGCSRQFYVYFSIHAITLLCIMSGSNIVAFAFLCITLFIPAAKSFFSKITLKSYVLAFNILFIFLVVMGNNTIFEIPIISNIIHNILGKDLTFSGRTYIWSVVLSRIAENPIFGHGIRETMDLFYVHERIAGQADYSGTYSAHNQILQALYEGGLILYTIINITMLKLSKNLVLIEDKQIVLLFKICISVVLIMYMMEVPSYHILACILNVSAIIPLAIKNNERDIN